MLAPATPQQHAKILKMLTDAIGTKEAPCPCKSLITWTTDLLKKNNSNFYHDVITNAAQPQDGSLSYFKWALDVMTRGEERTPRNLTSDAATAGVLNQLYFDQLIWLLAWQHVAVLESAQMKEQGKSSFTTEVRHERHAYYIHSFTSLKTTSDLLDEMERVQEVLNPSISPSQLPPTELTHDVWSLIFCFVSTREVCRTLRKVCKGFNDIAKGETYWSLKCFDVGIIGNVVSDLSSTAGLAEPSLFYPTPHGAPCDDGESYLPLQQAALAWTFIGSCKHITQESVEKLIRTCLAKKSSEMFQHRAALQSKCEVNGCNSSRQSQLFCVGCGSILCKRTGSAHMEAHSKASESHLRGCVAGLDPCPPGREGYCYACEGSINPQATHLDLKFSELQKLFAPRQLDVSLTHAGLFMRNECPHIDATFIKVFQQVVKKQSSAKIIATNCTHHQCASRQTFVCCHCGVVGCGINSKGHMHQHVLKTGHLVVLGVRSLNGFCFGCDRFLGVGGTLQDSIRAGYLREVLRDKSLFHHRANILIWDALSF